MADFSNVNINGKSYNCKDQMARNLISELQSALYPIGAIIYCSDCDTEAKVKLKYGGNSWSKIEGKFLLGADTNHSIGTTGGSETNSHTHNVTPSGTVGGHALTVAEMPSHNHGGATDGNGSHSHTVSSPGVVNAAEFGTIAYAADGGSGSYGMSCSTAPNHTHSITAQGNGGSHSHEFTGTATTSTGASDTNNMPPYKVVYIWERIS